MDVFQEVSMHFILPDHFSIGNRAEGGDVV
jgi:hypothetical protein